MKNELQPSGRETGNPNQLLTVAEAADVLGLKRQTLAAWRCERRYPLPFVRVGRSIRYRRSDLDAFLDARTVSPLDIDAE